PLHSPAPPFPYTTLFRSVLLFGLWIALTDNTRPLELAVGAGCALVGAAGVALVARTGGVHLRIRPRWALRALAAPWWVLRDSIRDRKSTRLNSSHDQISY